MCQLKQWIDDYHKSYDEQLKEWFDEHQKTWYEHVNVNNILIEESMDIDDEKPCSSDMAEYYSSL